MKIILTLIVFVVVLIAAFFIFIYSGVYNISAIESHTGLTEWVLTTAMDQSVRSHADGVKVPALSDESLIEEGFHHFDAMCVQCHGAPGMVEPELGRGLNPEPPDLAEEVEEGEWSDAELFWITKHGIKMSGMPAFGPTHTDEELWGIVAFLKHLPDLSPEEYETMKETVKAGGTNMVMDTTMVMNMMTDTATNIN
jgi:Cytochrome c, mono- and diheme variants